MRRFKLGLEWILAFFLISSSSYLSRQELRQPPASHWLRALLEIGFFPRRLFAKDHQGFCPVSAKAHQLVRLLPLTFW